MELVAITSYYNPFRGLRRRSNYDCFRRNLGVPLITVEWSPEGNFELKPGDADILLQVQGGDLVWQKERLLNLGLTHAINAGVARVAILDSDIVFTNPDWHLVVTAALDVNPIVQCFQQVKYLPALDVSLATRDDLQDVTPEACMPSMGYSISQGVSMFTPASDSVFSTSSVSAISSNPGLAFAARVDDHPDFRLYEFNLVGGGDLALIASLTGRLGGLFENRPYSPAHAQSLERWLAATGSIFSRFGYASNCVLHLWHGNLANRGYTERYQALVDHDYDPERDLVGEKGTPHALKTHAGSLKDAIARYLQSRQDA